MTTPTKLPVIDADAHVIETGRTWDYLEPSEQKFRPVLVPAPYDPAGRQLWAVEGRVGGLRFPDLTEPELHELSRRSGRDMTTPQASRELDDVALRLKHMDDLGIDVQVLHNTMWIEQVTQRPDVEAALCRAWNHWLGDIWKQAEGRLRWSCVIPTLMLDEAIVQMRHAKEHGAVAVCMRPLEGDRSVIDPYFYPVYEEASRLDLAVVVHVANANPENCDLFRSFPGGFTRNAFTIFRVPVMFACYGLMLSEIPELFPTLRWGFIEASAQWVPWVRNEVARRYEVDGKRLPDDVFSAWNIFVTCQTDDDIPWILRYAGEHSLIIGTDYGHTDPSSEVDAITIFKDQSGISQEAKDRILSHNPKALYAL